MASRRNSRNQPYSNRHLDLNNPDNWTSQQLRIKLQQLGIVVPKNIAKSVLKQFYLENKDRQIGNAIIAQTEEVSDPERAVPNPLASASAPDSSANVIDELRNPTADESSSRSNEATGSAHFDSVGGNNMAAIMQSFSIVSQSVAQCASGLQQTVSLIANQKCSEISSSKKFDLAQWYHNRNAEDAPLIGNGAIQSRLTPPSLGYSSITPGTTGVRSDSYSNVDIVAPSVQRNIIEGSWLSMESTLKEGTVNMKQITIDLIDQIWTTGRPSEPNSTINALPLEYAGQSWQDKITDMHTAMAEQNVDTLIVTGLDETAWLFNLRAKDIAFNPFFISYAIVDRKNSKTRLFLNDKNRKLTENSTDDATKQKLHIHLNTGNTGNCNGMSGPCVEVVDYITMLTEVQNINTDSGISQVWVAFQCNYALYSALSSKKVHQANTPAALIKTRKNAIEQQGMRNSHKRDAVALITFIANLEKTMKDGTKEWTEVSAALDLKEHRFNAAHNRGLSFPSISGSGPNGAVIHYFPTPATDRKLSVDEMYLLDSGGQYLDGTTDVTRTFHFGSPTAYQKECYTRVLMGQVDLARILFPNTLYGREIDAIARRPLWDVGLEYRHGTGHGIGSYLSVHEGPGRISLSHASFDSDEKLDEFMFFSDEPGYYEAGQFGIRLENIVMVTEAETKYNFMNSTFLTFETVTLVPYEPNLIDYDLLSPEQIKWINTYHSTVQKEIGPLVSSDPVASEWLSSRTQTVMGRANMGDNLHTNLVFLVLCAILTTLL